MIKYILYYILYFRDKSAYAQCVLSFTTGRDQDVKTFVGISEVNTIIIIIIVVVVVVVVVIPLVYMLINVIKITLYIYIYIYILTY